MYIRHNVLTEVRGWVGHSFRLVIRGDTRLSVTFWSPLKEATK